MASNHPTATHRSSRARPAKRPDQRVRRLSQPAAVPTRSALPRTKSAHTALIYQALLVMALLLAMIGFARHQIERQADPGSPYAPPPAVLVQPADS